MELLLHHPLEITYYKELEDKKNDIENLEFLFSGNASETTSLEIFRKMHTISKEFAKWKTINA